MYVNTCCGNKIIIKKKKIYSKKKKKLYPDFKNNSRRITYGIGCIWGMPSLSLLSSRFSYTELCTFCLLTCLRLIAFRQLAI